MAYPTSNEEAILDATVGKGAFNITQVWAAASNVVPSSDGTGTNEPSDGDYARVSMPSTNWEDAGTTQARAIYNSAEIAFPQAGADWWGRDDVRAIVLFDAVTAGNVVAWATVTNPTSVRRNRTLRIPAGSFELEFI